MRTVTKQQLQQMSRIQWWHRIVLGRDEAGREVVTPGECRHGDPSEDYATRRFGMPEDLTGKSVLDIGGWDGLFSFEAERRGARRVLLIDVPPRDGGNWGGTAGFEFARSVLGSKVEFQQLSVMELDPARIGVFDVVLCYGVMYHVKSPLVAIERIASVTGREAHIETARHRDDAMRGQPAWFLLPGCENDPTNYWVPTEAGLRTAMSFAGFTPVETRHHDETRMTLSGFKAV